MVTFNPEPVVFFKYIIFVLFVCIRSSFYHFIVTPKYIFFSKYHLHSPGNLKFYTSFGFMFYKWNLHEEKYMYDQLNLYV